jgi:hypothetical protein
MWRGPAVVLVALLSGCTCGGGPCVVGLNPPLVLPLLPPGRVNEQYTLLIPNQAKDTTCGSSPTVQTWPKSASAELLGPDSQPVPLVSPPTPFQPGQLLHYIFSPTAPGLYHFTVRFEADFGTQQVDMMVAADRSDAGVRSFDVPRECARFDHLGDVALCIHPAPDAGELFTVVNGQVVSTVPAFDFALAPELSAVWAIAPRDDLSSRVQLHQLTDAGVLTLIAEAEADQPAVTPCTIGRCPENHSVTDARLLINGGAALVLIPPIWAFATIDAGTLLLQQSDDPNNDLFPRPLVQWPGGSTFEALGRAQMNGGAMNQACELPLANGVLCSEPFGHPIGATAGGVWAFDEMVTQLTHGFSLGSNGVATAVTLPVGTPIDLDDLPKADSAPRWALDQGVVVLGLNANGEHALEYFDFDHSQATRWDVDSRHLWQWSASTGKLTFIER